MTCDPQVSKLLQEKKDALAEVERRIADLETQFKETTERKEDLQRQVDDCTAGRHVSLPLSGCRRSDRHVSLPLLGRWTTAPPNSTARRS